MEHKKIDLDKYLNREELDIEKSDILLNKYAIVIGQIVIVFNALEQSIDDLIIETMEDNDEEIPTLIIKNMTYYQKYQFLIDLLRHKNNENELGLSEELDEVSKKLKKVGEDRNAVVHAYWESIDENFYAETKIIADKEGIKRRLTKLDPKTMIEIYESIEDLEEELSNLCDRVNGKNN